MTRATAQPTQPIVGHITSTDLAVCLTCASLPNLSEYRVGELADVIVDPAPHGIYRPGRNSHPVRHSLCGVRLADSPDQRLNLKSTHEPKETAA